MTDFGFDMHSDEDDAAVNAQADSLIQQGFKVMHASPYILKLCKDFGTSIMDVIYLPYYMCWKATVNKKMSAYGSVKSYESTLFPTAEAAIKEARINSYGCI